MFQVGFRVPRSVPPSRFKAWFRRPARDGNPAWTLRKRIRTWNLNAQPTWNPEPNLEPGTWNLGTAQKYRIHLADALTPARTSMNNPGVEQALATRCVRDVARPVQALAAVVRRPDCDALDGRRRGRRSPAGLPPQAEFLRPGRRHRARRRGAADPVRAPRGPRRRHHQPEGAHLLRGRQHLHARRLVARVQGELLQVHQRDAAGDGGCERALRASSSCAP